METFKHHRFCSWQHQVGQEVTETFERARLYHGDSIAKNERGRNQIANVQQKPECSVAELAALLSLQQFVDKHHFWQTTVRRIDFAKIVVVGQEEFRSVHHCGCHVNGIWCQQSR